MNPPESAGQSAGKWKHKFAVIAGSLLVGVLVTVTCFEAMFIMEITFGKPPYRTHFILILLGTLPLLGFGIRFVVAVYRNESPIKALGKIAALTVLALAGFGYEIGIAVQEMSRGSAESTSKGNLNYLRSGMVLWLDDHDGKPPKTLQELVPKYLGEIPLVRNYARYHGHLGSVTTVAESESQFTDDGGWLYNSKEGKIYVNCTHTDSRENDIRDW